MKNHEKFKESDGIMLNNVIFINIFINKVLYIAYLRNVEQKGYSDDLKELVNNLKKIKLTRVTNLLNADGYVYKHTHISIYIVHIYVLYITELHVQYQIIEH